MTNFIDYLLSAVLMLITFAIGSSLRFRDFGRIFKQSKPLYLGLTLQMVFLPLSAFVIASTFDLTPEEKVGLFLVAICPGGTTSNFISYLINADTALAVALTTVNSLLILITIPLLSTWSAGYFMGENAQVQLDLWGMVWEVLKVIVIPLFVGLLFRRFFPRVSYRLRQPLKIATTLLLGLVFLIKFFAGKESGGSGISVDGILHLFPSTLLMHLTAMIGSYLIAMKAFRLSGVQSTTISIEVGLQNTVLAIAVASKLAGHSGTPLEHPALVYAMFSFFTTMAFAFITIRMKR